MRGSRVLFLARLTAAFLPSCPVSAFRLPSQVPHQHHQQRIIAGATSIGSSNSNNICINKLNPFASPLHYHQHHHFSTMSSQIPIPEGSDFTLANIPFGIFSSSNNPTPRPATRVGDTVLDLSRLAGAIAQRINNGSVVTALQRSTLNDFASLGREVRAATRNAIIELVRAGDASIAEAAVNIHMEQVKMHLPMQIGDYTDFYAGINHATNVGILFRGRDNALQPNYLHLPVGYHGRASTVVVSGTPVRRPLGQTKPPTKATPNFGPCQRLDIELEIACYVSRHNAMGEPVDIKDAEDHIFGYSLMNDWSARDIQAWEYVPLGPFNAKNFATTVSPWIVTDEALEPFRTARRDAGELLPYLRDERRQGKEVFDITLDVYLRPQDRRDLLPVFRSSSKELLYSFSQMLAHHTITGCSMNPGDLLGSGTISGTDAKSVGSLLEASEGGKNDIDLGDGVTRKWLQDGDEVVITGFAGEGENKVGFGDCSGVITPVHWGRWEAVQGKDA